MVEVEVVEVEEEEVVEVVEVVEEVEEVEQALGDQAQHPTPAPDRPQTQAQRLHQLSQAPELSSWTHRYGLSRTPWFSASLLACSYFHPTRYLQRRQFHSLYIRPHSTSPG